MHSRPALIAQLIGHKIQNLQKSDGNDYIRCITQVGYDYHHDAIDRPQQRHHAR